MPLFMTAEFNAAAYEEYPDKKPPPRLRENDGEHYEDARGGRRPASDTEW